MGDDVVGGEPQQPHKPLSVAGGAGGVDAQLTDIQAHSRLLADAGQGLLSAAPAVASPSIDDDVLASGVICPDILPGVLSKIAAAELGPDGVAVRGAALLVFAELTEAAVITYERIDEASAWALDKLQMLEGYAVGATLPVTGPILVSAILSEHPEWLGEIMDDPEKFLYDHPEVTEELTRLAPGLVQGTAMLGAAGLMGPVGPVVLSALTGGRWPTLDYEDSVAGLIAIGNLDGAFDDTGSFDLNPVPPELDDFRTINGISDIVYDQGTLNYDAGPDGDPGHGEVRVVTVTDGGETRLIVQVPGTQEWSPVRGDNPLDLTTNLTAMAGQDTVMQEAVVAAIRQAQQDHPGAQVMLTGHSQGGIVAGSIAADPELVQELNITSLVTTGSPIGRMDIDPAVSTLSVEHVQDPVPMLDGTGNPDRANWTTVRASAGMSPDDASAILAHHRDQYFTTGQSIDASTDPSIVAWREQNEEFFTGTQSSTLYDLEPTG